MYFALSVHLIVIHLMCSVKIVPLLLFIWRRTTTTTTTAAKLLLLLQRLQPPLLIISFACMRLRTFFWMTCNFAWNRFHHKLVKHRNLLNPKIAHPNYVCVFALRVCKFTCFNRLITVWLFDACLFMCANVLVPSRIYYIVLLAPFFLLHFSSRVYNEQIVVRRFA